MPAVTFTVPVKLLDYGNQPRVGVKFVAAPIPAVKKDSEAVYGTEPEAPLTDENGLATLTLISMPGLWYRIRAKGVNSVRFAAYIRDPDDPSTGTVFPNGTVIPFEDIVDENPTPGYSGLALLGVREELTLLDNGDGTLTIDGTGVFSNTYETITIGA